MDEAVVATEVRRLLDQGIETLRWCRQHAGQRGVAEKLQIHVMSMTAVGLALTYDADGRPQQALDALEYGDWRQASSYLMEERPE
jgi:hypothetical protein